MVDYHGPLTHVQLTIPVSYNRLDLNALRLHVQHTS